MEASLPRFEYLLDDLARVDGRQLRDQGLTPAVQAWTARAVTAETLDQVFG
jgi:hypothetical protein